MCQTNSRICVVIRTTPPVSDPRELNTIIVSSLRSLFGDSEPYSQGIAVLECRECSDPTIQESKEAIVECQTSSLDWMRAALTFSSTPSFLQGSVYRLEFLDIVP
mmetsp:Transcript_24052/g.36698  ORF Transcript_24052/g.36698 Transcript_24052/m.36698 type:complete len:105 (-) Transcript_24052:560-874(-)